MSAAKLVCEDQKCNWCGPEDDVLKAPNPFEPEEIVWGCPRCHEIETIVGACEVEGCCRPSTSGTPTHDGYRRTCIDHIPERTE